MTDGCVCCHEANADVQLSCTHGLCQQCYQISRSLRIGCPVCLRQCTITNESNNSIEQQHSQFRCEGDGFCSIHCDTQAQSVCSCGLILCEDCAKVHPNSYYKKKPFVSQIIEKQQIDIQLPRPVVITHDDLKIMYQKAIGGVSECGCVLEKKMIVKMSQKLVQKLNQKLKVGSVFRHDNQIYVVQSANAQIRASAVCVDFKKQEMTTNSGQCRFFDESELADAEILEHRHQKSHQFASSVDKLVKTASTVVVLQSAVQHQIHSIHGVLHCFLLNGLRCIGVENQMRLIDIVNKSVLFQQLLTSDTVPQKLSGLVTAENHFENRLVIRNDAVWIYKNQDVGTQPVKIGPKTFYLGLTCYKATSEQICGVQWIGGGFNTYRIGHQGFNDILYYDTQQQQNIFDLKSSSQLFTALKNTSECCLCAQISAVGCSEIVQRDADKQLLAKSDSVIYQPYTQCVILNKSDLMKAKFSVEKTAYPKLIGFQEKFRLCTLQTKDELRKSFQPTFATVPVLSTLNRLDSPAVVTIGPDWHHGAQCSGSPYNKIGFTVPNKSKQSDGLVVVRWARYYQPDFDRLIRQAEHLIEDMEMSINNTSPLLLPAQIHQQTSVECNIYEGGRSNIYELSFYEHELTQQNFRPLKIIGPSRNYQQLQQAAFGCTVSLAGQRAVILWEGGAVGRVALGELTYLE